MLMRYGLRVVLCDGEKEALGLGISPMICDPDLER